MDKKEVEKYIARYLKTHNLEYYDSIDDNRNHQIVIIYHDMNDTYDGLLESEIWFYREAMEVRVYYTSAYQDLCKKCTCIPDLYRFFNYVNARVWMGAYPGMGGTLYQSSAMYTPRIYMTEDGSYDITITTMIPYDFFSLAPVETMDYMTDFCPAFMNWLGYPIYRLLTGRKNVAEVIKYIQGPEE